MTNELQEHQHLISTVQKLSKSLPFVSFYDYLIILIAFEAYTMGLVASAEISRMCVIKLCSYYNFNGMM